MMILHSFVSLPEGKWVEPLSTNKMGFVIDPDELQPHTATSLECWLVTLFQVSE